MFRVLGPTPSTNGSGRASTRLSASTNLCVALSPSSGYAECAITPCALIPARSAPFDASAMRLSVGSPLIRKRLPLGDRLPMRAPAESRSSPTTNNNPTATPASRSRSAAASWATMIPLASHDPRP